MVFLLPKRRERQAGRQAFPAKQSPSSRASSHSLEPRSNKEIRASFIHKGLLIDLTTQAKARVRFRLGVKFRFSLGQKKGAQANVQVKDIDACVKVPPTLFFYKKSADHS